MGLLASLGSACLAYVLFQGMYELSESNVIETDAGNVTLCIDATGSYVECTDDKDCINAIVPPVDFRGFQASVDAVGTKNCTCYRYGNNKHYCAKVPKEPDYDYKYY
ncbi:hypothetical protein V5799_005550 [Amblyomma americanum]|uniref:Secreted protein n=1 Tax=Amblyomma americanum TaxID=6943 RepID=A0AAQ4DYX8_AMBAM